MVKVIVKEEINEEKTSIYVNRAFSSNLDNSAFDGDINACNGGD